MAKSNELRKCDNFQQDPVQRNTELADLLGGAWENECIESIRRDPAPTNPPDSDGPKRGCWIATLIP
jgi:hypothetical protein